MERNEAGSAQEPEKPWTFNTFMLVVGLVTLLLALLVAFGFSPAAFVIAGPFLIPAVVLTGLHLKRPRSWTYLAAGIANAYLFVLYLPFIVAGFSNPAIWTGFISSFLAIPVLTWNLSAGVLGFLQMRKGRPQLGVADGLRSTQGFFVIAIAALCLGAGITSGIAYNRAASNPQGGGFDFAPKAWANITTENTAFNPGQFTVRVNTITQITVTNKDSMLHTFTLHAERDDLQPRPYPIGDHELPCPLPLDRSHPVLVHPTQGPRDGRHDYGRLGRCPPAGGWPDD